MAQCSLQCAQRRGVTVFMRLIIMTSLTHVCVLVALYVAPLATGRHSCSTIGSEYLWKVFMVYRHSVLPSDAPHDRSEAERDL